MQQCGLRHRKPEREKEFLQKWGSRKEIIGVELPDHPGLLTCANENVHGLRKTDAE